MTNLYITLKQVSWNEYGMMYYGNRVKIFANIMLAGKRHLVCGESCWLKDVANILSQEFACKGTVYYQELSATA